MRSMIVRFVRQNLDLIAPWSIALAGIGALILALALSRLMR